LLDAQDDVELAAVVEALAASALVGGELGELGFPVTQDVRLQVGELADLADLVQLLFFRRRRARHASDYRCQASVWRPAIVVSSGSVAAKRPTAAEKTSS